MKDTWRVAWHKHLQDPQNELTVHEPAHKRQIGNVVGVLKP